MFSTLLIYEVGDHSCLDCNIGTIVNICCVINLDTLDVEVREFSDGVVKNDCADLDDHGVCRIYDQRPSGWHFRCRTVLEFESGWI